MGKGEKPDQTEAAKDGGYYETLFIVENLDAIFDKNTAKSRGDTGILSKTNKQGVSCDTNRKDQLGAMKVAFEPMGQTPHTISKKVQTASDNKRTSLKKTPTSWPRKVLSFELWAEATSYDPTARDGGVQFQHMLQFLLVDGPKSSEVKLNDDKYYSVKDKKHRGPGWYERKDTARFKGTPHSLGLRKDSYKARSWHTPETQGALNNPKHIEEARATGGAQGARSNEDDGYSKNRDMDKSIEYTIAAPYDVGSKLNWMLHCLVQ